MFVPSENRSFGEPTPEPQPINTDRVALFLAKLCFGCFITSAALGLTEVCVIALLMTPIFAIVATFEPHIG